MPKPIRRHDGRRSNEIRPLKIQADFVGTAAGSCLLALGGTRVICTASFSPTVPQWLAGKGKGWVTAEYGMLPASTPQRKSRPLAKPDSRSVEIQRLIGRTMRSIVDLEKLGENSLILDCDVLEADGGTRTAAINGAYVALAMAISRLAAKGLVSRAALTGSVAAISVGIVGGRAMLDLDYVEDASADVDMNVAMNGRGEFVELQGSSERAAFGPTQLEEMLSLARVGIGKIMRAQRQTVKRAGL